MPISKANLKRRKWPLPPFPIGREVLGQKAAGAVFYDDNGTRLVAEEERRYRRIPIPPGYLQSCYVDQERLTAVPLPISPGECGITSLVRDAGGSVFGATSGDRNHLFRFNPGDDRVFDLGVIGTNCSKSPLSLSVDGRLFIGTNPVSGDGWICSYDTRTPAPRIEKSVRPMKGEGVAALIVDNALSVLYGVTSRTGIFFRFNLKTAVLELKGAVSQGRLFSGALVLSGNGDVFGGVQWTGLFRYEAKYDRITRPEVRIPAIRGKPAHNLVENMIWDGETGSIFGGGSPDGVLLRFFPEQGRVISMGKIFNQPRIRCLTVGKDKCIYGVAGKSCCHLFRCNPGEGKLEDLGIVHVSKPRLWHGYEFDAAVTGGKGEIYLGENDRISHLFIYSAIQRRG